MQELYAAVWPGMRRDDIVASTEPPVKPEMAVDGWQVIAIRFEFPTLVEVTATVDATARVVS